MPNEVSRIREGFEGERIVVVPQDVARKCESLPVVRDLFATDIGHFPSAKHHFVERSSGTSETIFIYCIEGQGWCEFDGRTHEIGEGTALFIPKNMPHVYGADQDSPWSICWAHVKGQKVEDYLESLGVTAAVPTLHVPNTGLVVEAFEEVYAHVHHGYSNDRLLGISTALSRLFGRLKTNERAPNDRGREREDRILRSIQYMRNHLDESCSLEELAEVARFSPSHYSHLFKQQTNTSPIRFFIRLKMQRACELLHTTNQTVATIGHQVGYTDPFHFSRMFKKIIGKSPSEYREASLS